LQTQIIEQLIKQNRLVQKQVYFDHCDRLMRVISTYLKQPADAEEVLQDTFLQIFNKIKQYNPQLGNFESWSRKIAVNHSLMFLRKRKMLQISIDECNEIKKIASLEEVNLEYRQELASKMSLLNDRQALVFRLRAIEGYEYREIMEMLGLKSEENSRKIFSNAKQRLQVFFNTGNEYK